MNNYRVIFKNWFGYAVMISMLCGIIYIVVQQNFRQSANDPQYQMALDAANAINKGVSPKSLTGSSALVEIANSFSPYLVIYSANGAKTVASATLDGNAPKLPQGVLDNVKKNGMETVTWQPRYGIRQAIVLILTSNGYIVVAGRSLHNTEERISLLGKQVALGWVLSLAAMLVVAAFQEALTKRFGLDR
jgi:hypothetical protein